MTHAGGEFTATPQDRFQPAKRKTEKIVYGGDEYLTTLKQLKSHCNAGISKDVRISIIYCNHLSAILLCYEKKRLLLLFRNYMVLTEGLAPDL